MLPFFLLPSMCNSKETQIIGRFCRSILPFTITEWLIPLCWQACTDYFCREAEDLFRLCFMFILNDYNLKLPFAYISYSTSINMKRSYYKRNSNLHCFRHRNLSKTVQFSFLVDIRIQLYIARMEPGTTLRVRRVRIQFWPGEFSDMVLTPILIT